MATFRLGPLERRALSAGARALGVELRPDQVEQIDRFARVLGTWSSKINLISCRSALELVERHILDSLALVPHAVGAGSIVDLGSGAGFPGVPLAVAGASQRVALVESRRRRASFLRVVKRELGLENVEVLEQRAEEDSPARASGFTCAVCRAVWADEEILRVGAAWLRPSGRLLWMRNRAIASAGAGQEVIEEATIPYRVGSGRRREIHTFRRR